MQQEPEIDAAVQAFLARFSPPRAIAGNPAMVADEAMQITSAFSRYAPASGPFQPWWLEASSEVIRRMKTRAWPVVSEVEAACRAVNERHRAASQGLPNDAIEAAAIDRLEAWFRKFRDQMPSHGKPSRTMALINRGVFADLREARFFGFDLTADQMEQARDMQMGRAESEHHRRVHDRITASIASRAPWRDEIVSKHATVIPREAAE